jgi:hypothetical protein
MTTQTQINNNEDQPLTEEQKLIVETNRLRALELKRKRDEKSLFDDEDEPEF